MEGRLDAPVILVMYGDYQCPQSADVYKLIKAVQRQLSVSLGENYLCFIFRHFPQRQIHPHAQRAAEAAEAAQDQFWQMHEMLFNFQQALGDGYLVEYADHLGLNIRGFLQELSGGVHIDRINKDIESGIQSGVTVAPTLFINGIQYTDRWNAEQLIAAIIAANNQGFPWRHV
ncbi:DsbA family protein [Leptolyngbya sp. FACHB-36]|uniref:DsbA family protein n=1 Tax=Leptolyngbya sp. FACHB-36 TaxID=2692808 RepID=UPI0016816D8B|nr:DsbA family protein [Leptolyngbya sp. FACHB-36]MBD2021163.1 DsbA family protein [Leptolyngbya sp. FACHB-36]